jgi:hypothetical protein
MEETMEHITNTAALIFYISGIVTCALVSLAAIDVLLMVRKRRRSLRKMDRLDAAISGHIRDFEAILDGK